ncbi:hypothetical protein [Streptomyces sp. NPDC058657]|uniref:hypothetical protein n=1 Tax=unclassified Streptomyces TaxID=2593676 RepID=UPI00365AB8B5
MDAWGRKFGRFFTLTESLTTRQAKLVMATIPRPDAENLKRGRNDIAHLRYEGAWEGRHPLASVSARERAELVRSVVVLLPEYYAARFQHYVEDLLVLGDRNPAASCMLASAVLEVSWQLWWAASEIEKLEADQRARSQRHPRRMQMLTEAEIPLWVLKVVQGMPLPELQTVTPKELLVRAGRDDLGDLSHLMRSPLAKRSQLFASCVRSRFLVPRLPI